MNDNQIDNNLKELIEAAYSEGNVLLEKKSGIRDCTYKFSSSNGLYFPNTASVFTREIVRNDRYEWLNIGKSINNKSIFLRDVYKQWYSKGEIHGVPFYSFVLKYLLNKDDKEMLSLFHFFENKTINPVKFAIKVCGLFHFVIEFALLLNKKYLNFFLNRRAS